MFEVKNAISSYSLKIIYEDKCNFIIDICIVVWLSLSNIDTFNLKQQKTIFVMVK